MGLRTSASVVAPRVPARLLLVLLGAACGRASGYERPDAELTASSSLLRFAGSVGEVIPEQTLTVSDIHDLAARWRAVPNAPWVHLRPSEGIGAATVHVGVASRELAPGAHRAAIRFEPVVESTGTLAVSVAVELALDAPGWTALGGPSCGRVRALAVDPLDPTRVIAGRQPGALYVSNDNGATFARLPVAAGTMIESYDYPAAILLLPSRRAYAALGRVSVYGLGGVLRSDDSGNSWSRTALVDVPVESIVTAPGDDDFVLAGGPGLWLSRDGGATFVDVSGGRDIRVVVADPARAGRFLVGDGGGALYATYDGQLSTPLSTGSGAVVSAAVLADGAIASLRLPCGGCAYELERSRDGGASWEQGTGVGLPNEIWSVSARLFASGPRLYVLHSELRVSSDAGDTFATVPWSLPSWSSPVRSAAGDAAGALLLGRDDGIYRLAADGSLGATGLQACAVAALDLHPSGELYGAASMGGPFRITMDRTELLGVATVAVVEAEAIAVDPRAAAAVVFGAINSSPGWRRSSDGGVSWVSESPGMPGGNVFAIERAADDPDTLWVAGGSRGLFRSIDAGQSFTQVSTLSNSGYVAAVSSLVALAGVGGASLVRYDAQAGTSVEVAPVLDIGLVKHTPDGSVFYATVARGLFRSTDAQNFTSVGLAGATIEDLAVDPRAPERIFAATATGLFQSLDSGATWSEAGAPFSPTALAIDASGALYVGTDDGGVYRFTP